MEITTMLVFVLQAVGIYVGLILTMGITTFVINLITLIIGNLSGAFEFRNSRYFDDLRDHNAATIAENVMSGNIFLVSLMFIRQIIAFFWNFGHCSNQDSC